MGSQPRSRDGEWVDLVADLLAAPFTRWPAEPVIRQLVRTLEAPAGGFFARSASGLVQRRWPPEHFAAHAGEIARWTVRHAPTRHPVLRYYLATGDSRCMQVSDVPAEFADERLVQEWYELGRRWNDVPHQLAIPVFAGPRAHRAFVVGRADPFTRAEMAQARRLQRLLSGLDRQVATFARWSARAGPAAADVAGAVRLTPRELAVLELLADGLTAASIGRRLRIAERTVQKHLQSGYAKLGVDDRLAAVLRAQYLGLVRAEPAACGGHAGVRSSRHMQPVRRGLY